MTALVVTVALLGLCAELAAAPMNVPIRINELDETPATIAADLDFPAPLIGQELVFDPYSVPPAESDFRFILALNTTLLAPEPPPILLFPLGLACLALFVTLRRLAHLLRGFTKPSRPGRRRVRHEFRMMA